MSRRRCYEPPTAREIRAYMKAHPTQPLSLSHDTPGGILEVTVVYGSNQGGVIHTLDPKKRFSGIERSFGTDHSPLEPYADNERVFLDPVSRVRVLMGVGRFSCSDADFKAAAIDYLKGIVDGGLAAIDERITTAYGDYVKSVQGSALQLARARVYLLDAIGVYSVLLELGYKPVEGLLKTEQPLLLLQTVSSDHKQLVRVATEIYTLARDYILQLGDEAQEDEDLLNQLVDLKIGKSRRRSSPRRG